MVVSKKVPVAWRGCALTDIGLKWDEHTRHEFQAPGIEYNLGSTQYA